MRRLWSAATKATVTLFLPDANKNSRIPKKIVGIPHGFSFSGRWEPPFFPSGEPGSADGSARADEAPVPSSLLRRAFGSGQPVERRRRPASAADRSSAFAGRALRASGTPGPRAPSRAPARPALTFRVFSPEETARSRAPRFCAKRIFSVAVSAGHAILRRRKQRKSFFSP